MKRYSLLFLGTLIALTVGAQNETDALRYSYLNYNGTARNMGLGGAMGALGADMSAISMNPAGMGRYSRSDFSFTGDLTFSNTQASYDGNTLTGKKANFNFSNAGAVFVKPIPLENASLWRYFQFGITTTRTNDFHGETVIEGENDKSMLSSFTNDLNANNVPLDDASYFYGGLAYDAYLISHDDSSGIYTPWYNESDAEIAQTKTTVTRGAQYSTDIAFSGNYNGKLYVGGSFGFPRIRYSSSSTYNEVFLKVDSIYDTERFAIQEEVETRGSGFNMKLGMIYTPINFIRIGISVHSPTWYTMTDIYTTQITSEFTDDSYNSVEPSPDGNYSYRLKTPGRIMGSAAVLYKNRGFLTFEYEYVDYANAVLKDSYDALYSYDFNDENEASSTLYQAASIYKMGAEFRVTNFWTVRGGYAYYGSPIKDEYAVVDESRTNISGGVGYKNRNFSLDMTYLRSQWKEESYLFNPELVSATIENKVINNFIVTAGFRF